MPPIPAKAIETPTLASRIGRDEMNLSELPIALADRSQSDEKTIYFENDTGRLTVTSSDAYGLPTSVDTDVIVVLMYLTKKRNDFCDPKVNFSRYEILELLGWGHDGDSYKRLDESFNRWMGVTLIYDKCWFDNALKKNVSAKMHIIEDVLIADSTERKSRTRPSLPLSSFTWNKTFIQSCQADNLRPLDLRVYFKLKSGVAKRLYRFLGKRFFIRSDWTFDLNEIAFDRVGLSRVHQGNAGKIKERLDKAIKSLEDIGFIQPLTREERYRRIDRGHWTIKFSAATSCPALPEPEAVEQPKSQRAVTQRTHPTLVVSLPEQSPLVSELTSRGVTETSAIDLVQHHQADAIGLKIEVFDWLVEKEDKRVAKSPAGYLVKSINDDYARPKGFTGKAERERQSEAKRQREEDAAAARRRQREQDAADKAERQRINAYRKQLTPVQLAEHEVLAIAHADVATRQLLDQTQEQPFRRMLLGSIMDGYLTHLLKDAVEPA